MTALVILITGVSTNPELAEFEGAALTSKAFESVIGWFPFVLTAAVFLFAYSTMISWSYYGQQCWAHLFGQRSTILFKLLFLACVVLGTIVDLGAVLSFSDIMILCMAIPNIAGAMLLSGRVRNALDDYRSRFVADKRRTRQISPVGAAIPIAVDEPTV
jgi:AGCS family alanine or glycine:cation symporter